MPTLTTGLVVDRVDLVADGSNSAAFVRLYKGKESNVPMEFNEILDGLKPEVREVIESELKKAKEEVPEPISTELAKVKEDLTKAGQEVVDATAKATKLEGELEAISEEVAKHKATETEEDLMKSATPELQAMYKSLKDKAMVAEAALAKSREDAEKAQRVEKAKELKNLPAETEVIAELIKNAPDSMMALLKAANALIGENLQGSGASSGSEGGESNGGNAWEQIEKKAATVAVEHKLTKSAAIRQVMKDDPELYAQYVEEIKKGA